MAGNDTQAQVPAALSEDDAANLFLSRWSEEADPKDPADVPEETEEVTGQEQNSNPDSTDEEGDPETGNDGSETDHQEDDEGSTESEDEGEGDQEEEGEAKPVLDDEAVVKVKVDGQELDVSVKDLKRLYGQEAALTRKSQEVAQRRQEAEATAQRLNASLEKLYAKAVERFKPYSEIDWLVASKQLDAEQFSALRAEAQAAYEDFRFISEEADAFVKQQQQAHQEALRQAAAECVKTLKADIPNWSDELYGELREYAVSQGFDASVFNNIVDPAAIKLINKARLYDQTKAIKTTKKVIPPPKKVLKTTVAPTVKVSGTAAQRAADAKARLQKTGSVDDAAELFLSRWATEE